MIATPNKDALSLSPMTAVIIAYRKNRLNQRLLFGSPRSCVRRGWHRQIALFAPGDRFGFERWQANHYGTQNWQITVAKAVANGPIARLPGIEPGAELLLNITGKTRAKRVLACLDRLKREPLPLENRPDTDWREMNLRLKIGEQPDAICNHILAGTPC